MLVIETKGKRVIEIFTERERKDSARAGDLAAPGNPRTPKGGDIAILLRSLGNERKPVDIWNAPQVVTRENFGVIDVLRCHLKAKADGMTLLPKIVVTD